MVVRWSKGEKKKSIVEVYQNMFFLFVISIVLFSSFSSCNKIISLTQQLNNNGICPPTRWITCDPNPIQGICLEDVDGGCCYVSTEDSAIINIDEATFSPHYRWITTNFVLYHYIEYISILYATLKTDPMFVSSTSSDGVIIQPKNSAVELVLYNTGATTVGCNYYLFSTEEAENGVENGQKKPVGELRIKGTVFNTYTVPNSWKFFGEGGWWVSEITELGLLNYKASIDNPANVPAGNELVNTGEVLVNVKVPEYPTYSFVIPEETWSDNKDGSILASVVIPHKLFISSDHNELGHELGHFFCGLPTEEIASDLPKDYNHIDLSSITECYCSFPYIPNIKMADDNTNPWDCGNCCDEIPMEDGKKIGIDFIFNEHCSDSHFPFEENACVTEETKIETIVAQKKDSLIALLVDMILLGYCESNTESHDIKMFLSDELGIKIADCEESRSEISNFYSTENGELLKKHFSKIFEKWFHVIERNEVSVDNIISTHSSAGVYPISVSFPDVLHAEDNIIAYRLIHNLIYDYMMYQSFIQKHAFSRTIKGSDLSTKLKNEIPSIVLEDVKYNTMINSIGYHLVDEQKSCTECLAFNVLYIFLSLVYPILCFF